MRAMTTARWAALTVAASLVLAGCGAGNEDEREAPVTGRTDEGSAKEGTGEVRTDLGPLTDRFSALGTPESAQWLSGTLGGDAPGPTTYWIDAVIRLDDDVAAGLREMAPELAEAEPAVVEELRDQLPDGTLLTGSALDAAFGESGFWSEAYLAQDEPVLVLVSLGE